MVVTPGEALRGAFRHLRGRPFLLPQPAPDATFLGTEYGGYWVELAKVPPGGAVYSFGIGEDLSFDLALIERTGVTVHAFDPTPRSIAWAKAQVLPRALVVHDVALADKDGELVFFPPQDPSHVSHSVVAHASSQEPIRVPAKSLATLMKELGHEHVDVLKMDVEGAEYSVIDALTRSTLRPTQILLEFHHHRREIGLWKTQRALWQLSRLGYEVFAMSPSGCEFSFRLR